VEPEPGQHDQSLDHDGRYVLFGYVYFLQGDCDRRRRERWLLVTALTGAAWGLFGIVRVLLTEASGKALTIASTYSYGAFRPFFREHGTYSAYLGMLLPAAVLYSFGAKGPVSDRLRLIGALDRFAA